MVTVTMLPQSRPLTRDDLATMPDDGHRYELIDGALVVTPAPSPRHQRASARLFLLLVAACPDDLEVLYAPLDVVLADDTVVQPDLLVARRTDFTDRELPVAPLLAVEILSPSTRLIDLNLKRARYEAAGTPAYWVLDPEQPALTAWELQDGAYVEVAHVPNEQIVDLQQPFPVSVSPAQLLA
jgi:Uma2 family endonuclease